MKTKKTDLLKAIAFMVTVFFFSFFSACDPTVTPGGDPDDPDNPTSVDTMKPMIILDGIEKVTENQAEIFAWVKPYKNTKLFLEHRKVGETNYQKKAISGDYNGKDSIKVAASLFDLSVKTEYQLRIIATNKAGSDTSTILKISTYIVKDYDGNSYHVIKIGNQYWLQENLKATHFADGTKIPNITDRYDWNQTNAPLLCWPKNDSLNKQNGALYNGYVATSQKTIISGFRVPTESDFKDLINYIGGENQAIKLLDNNNNITYSDDAWIRKAHPEQNITGFNAKPNFERSSGEFFSFNEVRLWSQTIFSDGDWCTVNINMVKDADEVLMRYVWYGAIDVCSTQYKNWGMCIRLIK